jgi:hypothetical protein
MAEPVGGFKAFAELFETLADNAIDPLTKERTAEQARFYRDLAAITFNFPNGYKTQFEPRANPWRNRAEECRAMAEWFKEPVCRTQLFVLAETYDRFAKE